MLTAGHINMTELQANWHLHVCAFLVQVLSKQKNQTLNKPHKYRSLPCIYASLGTSIWRGHSLLKNNATSQPYASSFSQNDGINLYTESRSSQDQLTGTFFSPSRQGRERDSKWLGTTHLPLLLFPLLSFDKQCIPIYRFHQSKNQRIQEPPPTRPSSPT